MIQTMVTPTKELMQKRIDKINHGIAYAVDYNNRDFMSSHGDWLRRTAVADWVDKEANLETMKEFVEKQKNYLESISTGLWEARAAWLLEHFEEGKWINNEDERYPEELIDMFKEKFKNADIRPARFGH